MGEKCKENCELARCCRKSDKFVPGVEIAGSKQRTEIIDNGVGRFLCFVFKLTEELGAASFVRQLKETNITLEHNAPEIKSCYTLQPNRD